MQKNEMKNENENALLENKMSLQELVYGGS